MTDFIHPAAIGQHTGAACLPAATPCATLPPHAGIGLKPQHFKSVLEQQPYVGFFEVHAENYLVAGGPLHHYLSAIRAEYPLSMHGVGLSIGGESALNAKHLSAIAQLVDRYQPAQFSEHLAWSSHGENFYNDLLPLRYDEHSLARVCEHIDQVQTALKQPILLENPATYVQFTDSTIPEAMFVREVIKRSGCGLLLDVNNVYVSCINHHWNARAYLDELPLWAVGEIHLAGFAEDTDDLGERLLIDHHGAPVADSVWKLYLEVLHQIGPKATLIEWDNDVPSLERLLSEAEHAEHCLHTCSAKPQGIRA